MSDLSDRSYREIIYNSPQYQGPLSSAAYRRAVTVFQRLVRGWLPADRQTPILDMGCGQGIFLFGLDELGYTDLTGIDLGEAQTALARQFCPRARILQMDIREFLAAHPGRFGLIAGFDIIEHFHKEEIIPLLRLIAGALRPGGRLILQTPNGASPWVGVVAYGDFTHEWLFTPTSLANVLASVGLTHFEARPCEPLVHGLKSLVRQLLWQVLKLGFALANLVETGSLGDRIYCRFFLGTAVKP